MRVLLDEHDIKQALENFVSNAGISGATGVKLAVINGDITAEVLFGIQDPRTTAVNQPDDDEDEDLPKPKSRGGRPAGSKNKPKEEVSDNVGASSQSGSGRGAEGTQQASGASSEEDDDDFLSSSKGKGGSKNPTTDSQEESSSDNGNDTGKEAKDVSAEDQPVKKSRSSIFDDD